MPLLLLLPQHSLGMRNPEVVGYRTRLAHQLLRCDFLTVYDDLYPGASAQYPRGELRELFTGLAQVRVGGGMAHVRGGEGGG